MKFGIIVFPGTWSDTDCHHALSQVLGQEAAYLPHKNTSLKGFDCVVLPGGFSYGDYLRTGAIARFAPIMEQVAAFAGQGGLVIGICNGFQILCEAGLLPGALLRNRHLEFRCQWVHLRVENTRTPFTNALDSSHSERSEESRRGADGRPVLRVPISHGEGNFYADAETLAELEANNQVVFRYCDESGAVIEAANPNGSIHNIAGIINRRGNVLGMMPHPERCCEDILGGADGRLIFESLVGAGHIAARTPAAR